ncbi:hypothetical protein ABE501_18695 [Comamonas testosteroni]
MSISKTLYIYTIFCEVILLRKNGRRLSRSEWERPLRGMLELGWRSKDACVLNRYAHEIGLYEKVGTSSQKSLVLMFEPRVVAIDGQSLIWVGTEVETIAGRVHEFMQAWHVTPINSQRFEPPIGFTSMC